ncbi:MAG TPA: M23 family metallopeptidase [Lachnospiraceae bacterium]|nr:M23 family metallopeptidase [Lachnospiraceae bacterium]
MKRRRRRPGLQKERIVMIAASVFVMSALTLTGVYLKQKNNQTKDGYLIDFSTLEKQATNKSNQVGEKVEEDGTSPASTSKVETNLDQKDMDADPFFSETNSQDMSNYNKAKIDDFDYEEGMDTTMAKVDVEKVEESKESVANASKVALNFSEDSTLKWPIVGNVLLNYSMNKTIYFATLEQYKYNPSIVIAATEGESIGAAINGIVTSIFSNEEIGNAIIMDIGNGYELTYGQLDQITVSEGSNVKTGDILGVVKAPTKYYSVEGCNVYFKLTKDGIPINPLSILE